MLIHRNPFNDDNLAEKSHFLEKIGVMVILQDEKAI